jgi:hypothetical protein
MKKLQFLIVIILFQLPLSGIAGKDIVIGKKVSINSAVLGEERTMLVYLPDSYEFTDNKYPVLYLLDGGYHFHHVSGIVNFLSGQGKIPEMIIVGITNIDRNRDFLPPDPFTLNNIGQADRFMLFLKQELLPYMNSKYRTQPYNIIMGHSHGGNLATNLFINHPDLFDGYISISPTLWYANNSLITQAEMNIPDKYDKAKQYYMTLGNEPRYFESLSQFQVIIQNKNPELLEFEYVKMPEENHGTIPHLSVYNGLEFIFDGWIPSPEIFLEGLKSIDEHYKKQSRKYGFIIEPTENIINRCGYAFLNDGNTGEAIKVFKANVARFPASANVYDSLGEAYEKEGNLKLALDNYSEASKIALSQNHPNLGVYLMNMERVKDLLDK